MRPVQDHAKIWRYFRLPAFMEMLMHSALFQARVTEFDDPLEGAFGYRSVKFSDQVVQYLDPPRDRTYRSFSRVPDPDAPLVEVQPLKVEDVIYEARQHVCVTCWYEHDATESYAMWRVYGADSFAVAVETTVGALRRALSDAPNVVVGGVEYSALPNAINSVQELFFHKRPEFSNEREIRSVALYPERITGPVVIQSLQPEVLDELLGSVIVAPQMRATMVNTLRGIIQGIFRGNDRHFDSNRLRQSSLDAEQLP